MQKKSNVDLLFFSLVTQSTVGYGDVVPLGGFGRAVASLQIVSGLIYLAVVPALVLARLLTPGTRALRFSTRAIFDPHVGQYRIRFVNESMLTASRAQALVKVPIHVQRDARGGAGVLRYFRIKLVQSDLWLLETHVVIVLETEPTQPLLDVALTATSNILSGGPWLVADNRVLQVALEVQFPIGATQVVQHEYQYGEVLCGRFRSVSKGTDRRHWSRFDEVEEFPASAEPAPCLSTCLYRVQCNLSNKIILDDDAISSA
jgi:hypothetical protein